MYSLTSRSQHRSLWAIYIGCPKKSTRPQGEERLAECPPDAGRRDTRAAAPCELRPPARLGLLAVFRRKLRVAIDIRFNAKAHSLPASRSPSLASPIITLAIAIVARSLRSINPSWPKAASNAADMLGCLLAQTNDRRARAARKQLRLALCERRRAGFARLSGWQAVGNWVASAGEFSSIPVTRRRYPDNEQRIATRSLRRKMARRPSRAGGRCTRPCHRKGQKPSPAAG